MDRDTDWALFDVFPYKSCMPIFAVNLGDNRVGISISFAKKIHNSSPAAFKIIMLTTSRVIMMTSSNANIFRVTGYLCGDSPVPGEFPAQWPVTRSIDVFFDLRLNKRLSKQSWGWWFEMLSRPLWRYCNVIQIHECIDTMMKLLYTHCIQGILSWS